MGEGRQGEITVSFFFSLLSLQLGRTEGDTGRGAHSPLLDSFPPGEEGGGEEEEVVVLIATSI